MVLLEAIEQRRSRRKYLSTPMDSAKADKLQALIDEYNQIDGVDMRLVLGNGSAFAGLRKSYGMFSGVQNYIGLIDRIIDPDNPSKYRASENTEKMGYYGELLVLYAVMLGLGTCWVGGSFDRRSCPFVLEDGEMVACTVTVGNVADEMSTKEKFLRSMIHRKTKTVEDMFVSDSPVPDWFMAGMRAVQRAPSAVNRQPVIFTYRDGVVSASVQNPSDVGTALDFGIAKLHFEIGAGGEGRGASGAWEFGNGGAFKH